MCMAVSVRWGSRAGTWVRVGVGDGVVGGGGFSGWSIEGWVRHRNGLR